MVCRKLRGEVAAIWWVVPIVAMTVVSVAIPTALPSWREALNRVEARPVAAEVMVAKAAACEGANTCAIATPSSSIIARIHHRLVEKPTSVIRLMLVATPARPPMTSRRGPSLG